MHKEDKMVNTYGFNLSPETEKRACRKSVGSVSTITSSSSEPEISKNKHSNTRILENQTEEEYNISPLILGAFRKQIYITRISGSYGPFILAPAEGCWVGLWPITWAFGWAQ